MSRARLPYLTTPVKGPPEGGQLRVRRWNLSSDPAMTRKTNASGSVSVSRMPRDHRGQAEWFAARFRRDCSRGTRVTDCPRASRKGRGPLRALEDSPHCGSCKGDRPMMKFIHIKKYEVGLRFYRGEFVGLLGPGKHRIVDPLGRTEIEIVDGRAVYLRHADLDVIVKSGALAGKADVYELTDMQRALVWIDGRFNTILGPGLHAL